MRTLKTVFVFAAGMAGWVASAFAGAGIITTKVTPLQVNVTYSKLDTTPPLVTYIGYTVSIANGGGNTINNIRFTGGISLTDTVEKATFISAEGANCVPTSADKTQIECTIGQLTAGKPFPTFAVFFKAPVKNPGGGADDVTPDFEKDYATFAGKTYYAEGTGGPNSTPENSIRDWTALADPAPVPGPDPGVKLGTFNPEEVKSAVPKGIAQYVVFTGDRGISKGTDKQTTLVKVPALTQYTTVEITESVFDDQSCSSFLTCDQSKITIPLTGGAIEFSPYLTIVLRQDASNIRAGTKIGNVLIDYVDDLGFPHPNISDCGSRTTPRGDHVPCIAERKYYKNRSVPGWTPDLNGDFEWTLINLSNGVIRFPS